MWGCAPFSVTVKVDPSPGRESTVIDAAHHLGQRPGERQPDSGAVDPAGFGAEPVERGEEPSDHRRIDAGTVVTHARARPGRCRQCQA